MPNRILMASVSFGGGTFTAWKRRSSDRSFSIDLRFASHQRIKLCIHRRLGQVTRELAQQRRLALPLRLHLFLAAPRQFLSNRRQPQPTLVQDLSRKTLFFS